MTTTEPYLRSHHDPVRESRRRLLIGLSGLSVMLLLVMLVSWLTAEARQEAGLARAQAEAAGVPKQDVGGPGKSNDSLADMGVAPAQQSDVPTAPSSELPLPQVKGDTLVVPDLQPDPQLDPARSRR